MLRDGSIQEIAGPADVAAPIQVTCVTSLVAKGTTMAKLRRALIILTIASAFAIPGGGVALAKITPVDVSCTNNGGNQPGGQQPTCNNESLTQESENQNPSGQAPPGQNP
jgi:hypothetical protein